MLDALRQKLLRRLEKLTGQSRESPEVLTHKSGSLRAQGNTLIASGDLAGAEALFRESLELDGEDTPTTVCLGYVLNEQGRFSEARVILNRAAHAANKDPAAFEAYYLLGQISERQGDMGAAEIFFLEALRLKPDFSRACNDLVRLMQATSRQAEVKELLLRCIGLCPNIADYRMALAKLYVDSFDSQGAAEHLMAAAELGVNDVFTHMSIGAALSRLGRESEAIKFFQMAEEQDPSVANETNFHLGYLRSRSGDVISAISALEKSIQHDSGYLLSHSLMLLVLSFANGEAGVSYEFAAKRFNKAVKPVSQTFLSTPLSWSRDCNRPLCVGFMSGEFRLHPVYFFLVDVLKHIDLRVFRPVVYSHNPFDDAATAVLKERVPDWHDLRGLTNEGIAKLIRSHHVDILIDLSGHSGDNRLAVFAHRPAPVQVTWLGYFASTGLEEMDYILADPVSVPADSQEWFSEQVVRLPTTRLCMAVPTPSRQILVAPPPCLRKGYVTFGSFQQAVKITRKVISVWARVLNAVPQSRLRIQTQAIHAGPMRDRICADLTQAGIDMSKVELVGSVGLDEYLEAHAEVDILLDTFPYTGGTTTAFALWMGVPTVSLVGSTMLARQGAMMLNCVGLSDWAVNSEDAYVAAAERFARDVELLTQLRHQLRDTALKSPLFDSKRFAIDLQDALLHVYEDKQSKESDGKCPAPTTLGR